MNNILSKIWKGWNDYVYSNYMIWTLLIFTSAICLVFYLSYEKVIFLIAWTSTFAIMFQRFINWCVKDGGKVTE